MSHKAITVLGSAVVLIILITIIGFAVNNSTNISVEDLSPEEITRIESMKARIQQAPVNTLILREDKFGNVEYEKVAKIIQENILLKSKAIIHPYPRDMDAEYLLSVKSVTYPGDEDYTAAALHFVEIY